MNRLRRIAADRDKAIMAQREAEAPALEVQDRHLKTLKLAQMTKFCPPDKVNLAASKKNADNGRKRRKKRLTVRPAKNSIRQPFRPRW